MVQRVEWNMFTFLAASTTQCFKSHIEKKLHNLPVRLICFIFLFILTLCFSHWLFAAYMKHPYSEYHIAPRHHVQVRVKVSGVGRGINYYSTLQMWEPQFFSKIVVWRFSVIGQFNTGTLEYSKLIIDPLDIDWNWLLSPLNTFSIIRFWGSGSSCSLRGCAMLIIK